MGATGIHNVLLGGALINQRRASAPTASSMVLSHMSTMVVCYHEKTAPMITLHFPLFTVEQ